MDYDKHYVNGPGQCGEPFAEFISFFESYEKVNAAVLDLGCGQGRDALVAAQHGHRVLGVDLSEVGVAQMVAEADRRGLQVEGVVADLVDFKSRRRFDVVVLDRVLHCLPTDADRLHVLEKSCRFATKRGHVLIADTRRHRSLIRGFFEKREGEWEIVKRRADFLFARRRG